MGLDLLIPFGILLVLVIYLIYTRSKFEKDVVQLYEKKFEEVIVGPLLVYKFCLAVV